ncbi:Uncharacterized protein FWK35_00004637 [Aphis craccivora]|uniref:Uncharacterized protein n=1 Tax=Aphis craccivora TaxID=307492 RepID=A0A6G0YWN9_APHCR|nr:Uncharacterized protein FWK35_00004637 [Aphis craccivora]
MNCDYNCIVCIFYSSAFELLTLCLFAFIVLDSIVVNFLYKHFYFFSKMQNEGVSKKFDSILKSINDMKITQNKLINSFGDIECKLDRLSKKFEDYFNENKLLVNTISNIESRLSILEARPSNIASEETYSEISD